MNTDENMSFEKVNLINWITSIQDVSLLNELKSIQSKNKIVNQAILANKAIEDGDVISQEDLRQETKNW